MRPLKVLFLKSTLGIFFLGFSTPSILDFAHGIGKAFGFHETDLEVIEPFGFAAVQLHCQGESRRKHFVPIPHHGIGNHNPLFALVGREHNDLGHASFTIPDLVGFLGGIVFRILPIEVGSNLVVRGSFHTVIVGEHENIREGIGLDRHLIFLFFFGGCG